MAGSEVEWVADAVLKTVRTGETALRKAWTLLEAATEQKRPSEFLSPAAIRRIQGRKNPLGPQGGQDA